MTRPEFAQNLIQARLSRGLGVESAFPFLLPGRRSILDRVIFAAPDNCASLSLHCGLLISDRPIRRYRVDRMCTDDLGDVLCCETNVLPDSAKGDGVLAGAFVKPALWQFQSIGGLLYGEKAQGNRAYGAHWFSLQVS
jgi:hypothetical protein